MFSKKSVSIEKSQKAKTFDVVVIGGGITGVLNAYYQSKAGKRVALVEASELGKGATSATTAFITEIIDTDPSKVEDLFGNKAARLVFESHRKAINEIEVLVNDEKLDCDFIRCPNHLYASTKKQFESIREEFNFYKKFGLTCALRRDGSDLNFQNFGYMEVFNQAKFSASKFIKEVAKAAKKNGAVILENTKVLNIDESDGVQIKTTKGNVRAEKVIICTYKPLTNLKTHLKKGMYRSYVFQVEIEKNSLKEALYEDAGNPYHYFRVDPGEEKDSMTIGGEDHKDIFGKSLRKKSFAGLEKYLKKILGNRKYRVVNRWDGPILEPSDGLALIGEIKPNFYVATAFSGNGMTYSMISAMILRDLILENKNPWKEIYDPKRSLFHPKRLASKAKDFVEEFFGGVVKNLIK